MEESITSTGNSNPPETDDILKNGLSKINDLIKLIKTLRGEDGCPWDRAQTPSTLTVYLVEEMYELVDAIKFGSPEEVCEELGDVLFQIFFLARIFQEREQFTIADVAQKTTDKMVARHPHVFGDEEARTAEDVRARWHEFKKKENGSEKAKGHLDSIPKSLPALMRAYRIVERASRVGFHRPPEEQGLRTVDMQWQSFREALETGDSVKSEAALGDFLLNLSGLARGAGIHPDKALSKALDTFTRDFGTMEKALAEQGRSLDETEAPEMEALFGPRA